MFTDEEEELDEVVWVQQGYNKVMYDLIITAL